MANELNQQLSPNTGKDDTDWLDFDDISKKYKLLYTHEKKYYELREKLAEQYNLKQLQDELKNNDLSLADKEKKEKELADTIRRIQDQAAAGSAIYRQTVFEKASAQMKAKMLSDEADAAAKRKQFIEEEYAKEYALAEGNSHRRSELTKEYQAKTIELINEEAKIRKQQRELENSQQFKSIQRLQKDAAKLKDNISLKNIDKVAHSLAKVDIAAIDKELEERVDKAAEEIDNLEADYAELERLGASQEKLDAKAEEIRRARDEKDQAAMLKVLTGLANNIKDTYKQAFNAAETMMADYRGYIDARMQGSDKSYDKMMGMISTNLSMSPYVKTQDVIESMREASDQGIAYNIEQRAFLSNISDRIANTFDAFDSNLTRLIRLQQADTTAARLGMEAGLTKFFNSMFQDTSYLNQLSDSISGAIIDANASLDRNASAEFEYIVQKWMGSLSSLGMSDNTLTNIATGINYLATGDVTSLASNTSLQTLFAMSASNAGLDYAQLLLDGLNASNTNKLLESMVLYLKDIAENSDNQVVRSAYGDIFNMSLSDMKAITNLSKGDISTIAANSMSYGGMQSELTKQMLAVATTRTHISTMLSNLYNNAIFGVAEDMASNPATYAMTKMLDFMESSKLDMAIPFVNAMGFGIDLNTSVQDIMRLGVGLSQAFNLMTNILGGLGSAGGLNLGAWGGTEYTQRGSGSGFSTSSLVGGTSSSTYVATSSSDDMKNSSLSSATDDAEETGKITNKNSKVEHTFDDFYEAVIGPSAKSFIINRDLTLYQVMDTSAHYLNVKDGNQKYEKDKLLVYDSTVKGEINSLGTEKRILKVEDTSNPFESMTSGNALQVKASDSTNGMLVKIQALDSKLVFPVQQELKLDSATTITIDEKTLITAFKKALGNKEGSGDTSIDLLYKLIKEENAVMQVKNKVGTRVEVDTEQSGYHTNINW